MNFKQKESYKLLFREFYNPLCNYAFSILKDRSLSEDTVQDVFTKLWDKKDQLEIDSVKSYLFKSTKNKAIEKLRQQKRSSEHNETIRSTTYVNETHEDQADKYLLKEKLFNSIRQLPPKCQEIFVLSKMNGLTYSEIADDLQLSVKTVENQIGRALRLLRTKMS